MKVSFYNWFTREAVLGLEDLIKGTHLRRQMALAKDLAFSSRADIERYQLSRLKHLVQHACTYVPYYRELARNTQFRPEMLRAVTDISVLPPLDRATLFDRMDQLVSPIMKHRRGYKGLSSGSTGQIVGYYRDRYAEGLHRAAQYVGYAFAGWHPGTKTCTIWGNRRTVENFWAHPASKLKQRLLRNLRIPAFVLEEGAGPIRVLEMIRQFSPEYLEGYSGSIAHLAEAAIQQGIVIPVKGVFTTAETLFPAWRRRIEKAFGPVYDGYGCGEILAIAYQCVEGSYHVMESSVIVEYEPIEGEEACALLVTDLHNYAMPFIRYRVGDIVVPSRRTCPCGRTFKTIAKVIGRTSDVIETRSGGHLVVPSFFGSAMDSVQRLEIKRYQIAITGQFSITIRVVVGSSTCGCVQEHLLKEMNSYLGHELDVQVEVVDCIPTQPSGKHKLVIDERRRPAIAD